MAGRYINPYTDFGFKKLFGEEGSKDLLIDFLNQLLPAKHSVNNLACKPPEQLNEVISDRRAIFDIFCQNENGERFIVEMQKAKHNFFKDRAAFYSTFPIREQAEKGEWNFKLNPVYCVALLDFKFDDERKIKGHLNHIQLKDQHCQTFYDKLTYIYLEMPRFEKEEDELEDHFDKWLYFLKNLNNFESIPGILNETVFTKAFKIAELANYDQEQLDRYEESLKVYRDVKGVVDSALENGEKSGEKKKAIEIAKRLKAMGLDIETISKGTGLSKEEIEQL